MEYEWRDEHIREILKRYSAVMFLSERSLKLTEEQLAVIQEREVAWEKSTYDDGMCTTILPRPVPDTLPEAPHRNLDFYRFANDMVTWEKKKQKMLEFIENLKQENQRLVSQNRHLRSTRRSGRLSTFSQRLDFVQEPEPMQIDEIDEKDGDREASQTPEKPDEMLPKIKITNAMNKRIRIRQACIRQFELHPPEIVEVMRGEHARIFEEYVEMTSLCLLNSHFLPAGMMKSCLEQALSSSCSRNGFTACMISICCCPLHVIPCSHRLACLEQAIWDIDADNAACDLLRCSIEHSASILSRSMRDRYQSAIYC